MHYNQLSQKMLGWQNKNKYSMFFMRYFMYFYNLAITRFHWINLPNEIPERYLEDLLFFQTQALFFYDDAAEWYAATAVNLGGMIDNYQVPDTRFAYAMHYYAAYDKTNSVIIWDSMGQYPMCDLMMMHADALANMRMTRDANIYGQRHPIAISGPKNARLSMANFGKQYNDFVPWIELREGFNDKIDLKAIDLKVPIVFPELDIEMKQEIAWALTELGISSTANFKRERVSTQEASGNSGEMEMARMSALATRQRAAEQINRMFGLDVRVEFRSEIPIPGVDGAGAEKIEKETSAETEGNGQESFGDEGGYYE